MKLKNVAVTVAALVLAVSMTACGSSSSTAASTSEAASAAAQSEAASTSAVAEENSASSELQARLHLLRLLLRSPARLHLLRLLPPRSLLPTAASSLPGSTPQSMSKGSGLAPTGQAGAFFALRRKETPAPCGRCRGSCNMEGGGVMRKPAAGVG